MSTTSNDAPADHDPTPRPTNPREIPIYARLGGGEIWRDVVGTDRDDEPGGRFIYVAERLIADARMRERVIVAMHAVRERHFEKRENHYYRFESRAELDAETLVERVRATVRNADTIAVATMTDLVPKPAWMAPDQWTSVFRSYVEAMTGQDGRNPHRQRAPLASLFGFAPMAQFKEFEQPARSVLTGNLVHKVLMGDLAELLALAGAYAAAGLPEEAERSAAFVMEAAKAPPMIVATDDGGFHLIHVCR